MTVLHTDRLTLRPWRAADFDLFHHINADERVMRFFPTRRTREQSREFFDYLIDGQSDNRSPVFQAVEVTATGECIGLCGLHTADAGPFIGTDAIEIGWRLAARHWDNGYATESARAWLAHGFQTLGLDAIVSFAVHANAASVAVMRRIGSISS